MKRELKVYNLNWFRGDHCVAEIIPMKRELKETIAKNPEIVEKCVAEIIPMKRELKVGLQLLPRLTDAMLQR